MKESRTNKEMFSRLYAWIDIIWFLTLKSFANSFSLSGASGGWCKIMWVMCLQTSHRPVHYMVCKFRRLGKNSYPSFILLLSENRRKLYYDFDDSCTFCLELVLRYLTLNLLPWSIKLWREQDSTTDLLWHKKIVFCALNSEKSVWVEFLEYKQWSPAQWHGLLWPVLSIFRFCVQKHF